MAYRIFLKPLGLELACSGEEDLLTTLQEAGIGVASICGGLGSCGKCRVHLLEGDASEPTPEEEHLSREKLSRGMRLACQLHPRGDLSVYLPASSLTHDQRLQLACELEVRELQPAVQARELEVEVPSAPGDPGSDLLRVMDALRAEVPGTEELQVDLMGLRELSPLLRAEGGKVRALVRGKELLGIAPRQRRPLGLAVDLGSTKVALFLHDLDDGSLLASRGFLNPQVAYGEDVVTRIQHAGESEANAARLADLVASEINLNLSEMLAGSGASPGDVYEMVLVGNTAMHHLFLRLPVEQLGKSPYLPATDLPLEVKARELGLGLHPSAVVYLPPPIAGYVGSDHLAAVAAARLQERDGPCLLLDIGTNTEVALQTDGRIRCCSCASGPAFEGGGLRQGMRAGEGAIEQVTVDPETGEPELSVIGDAAPVGICGSGILGALAAMLEAGVIDASGRMQEGKPRLERRDGEFLFHLSPPVGVGEGVAVTQNDVREIQKAKGAIRAGVDALLREAGISPLEVKEVILAGAFGTYIDPAAAAAVALLPPIPLSRIDQVGNAAGAGARSLLLSTRLRREAEDLAGRLEYLELSVYPGLNLLFAADMFLGEEAVQDAKRRFKI